MSVFKCNLLMIYFFRNTVKSPGKLKNFLAVFFSLPKAQMFFLQAGTVELN